jgi:hypothetical protein
MNSYVDLKELSTPQLLAIRNILLYGVEASARTITAEVLKKEYEKSQLLQRRTQMIINNGLADLFDFENDGSYILSFSDTHFEMLLKKLLLQKRATAQRNEFKIPPVFHSKDFNVKKDLNVKDVVRKGFKEYATKNEGYLVNSKNG